ncbi:hypothetical protein LCGC14_1963110 [marine sediment metagenome]|uniref:Uncharacterized protein n=1 Tax=marine sediment metagenome TaxID=412755 RepID=A0A0F9FEB4_9ZZZZ
MKQIVIELPDSVPMNIVSVLKHNIDKEVKEYIPDSKVVTVWDIAKYAKNLRG